LGYIDPDWMFKYGKQKEKEVEELPKCSLSKKLKKEYFLTEVNKQVEIGVKAAEEKYNKNIEKYLEKYADYPDGEFDDEGTARKLYQELHPRYMDADEGINVKLRMKELHELSEGVEINDKYNPEVMKQVLTGEHGELVARAIALYEYSRLDSRELLDVLDKVSGLQ